MKPSLSYLRRQTSRCGFSLVEVVLATGIMALGVVTILGLLPHGLELSRKTANEQSETRIVDQIVGELQTINWANLEAGVQENRFFDDQGLELVEGQTGGADINSLLSYVVQVNLPPLDVRLPSNDTNANRQVNQNLRRVIVKIIAAPIANFNFDAPASGVPIKTVTQLVANTGLEL
ncbi:uncharacterized protein (TIGR02598 family) [Prosthecobacter fusiformis]|uniref:Uncharacterized protein (TIGR02598 family) n=1 Tax=Prosthecobacter fusiformis TaxID=48464 RepID=A0A4R7S0G4_9BACT|nr:Verru_Chthon cassette protein B [Prosthecobacter fusiformis]TDU71149.1 uncharacterized protein (TIGR02598 family) [Prosthecobacter fusiformis]